MILKDVSNTLPLHNNSNLLDLRRISSTPLPQADPISCYFPSIFQSALNSIEHIHYPYQNSTDSQLLLRNRQIDWMFYAQPLLDLSDDTVFDAVLLMDKYLSLRDVVVQKMRLLAVVCLMTSSKSNEIYPIRLNKVNQISRVHFSPSEVVDLEMEILTELGFSLPHGTVFQLFKLYLITLKLEGMFKREPMMWILRKCLTNLPLLQCGIKAASLASITFLCRNKRILVNMGGAADNCPEYPKALHRIGHIIQEARVDRQCENPEA